MSDDNGVFPLSLCCTTCTNRDMEVTIADIVLVVAFVTGSLSPDLVFNEAAADVDGNGIVDISDIVQLVNLVVS